MSPNIFQESNSSNTVGQNQFGSCSSSTVGRSPGVYSRDGSVYRQEGDLDHFPGDL